MARLIKKGSTDITDYVVIRDSADGTVETGVTITDLDLQYVRNGAAPSAKVDATALAAIDSAHGDNKMFEVDSTDQPGLYRVDWPDAAFATGVDQVVCTVKGTGFDPVHKEYQLVDFDPEDAVRLGLTALPNAAADAAGGLPISDAGGLDLDSKLANTNEITAARMSELDAGTGGKMANQVDVIAVDVAGLDGDAMRGTDNAATAAELAKVPKSDGTATWNATALASINSEVDTALSDYDPPTKAELDAGLAGLNDLTEAQVNAQVDLALNTAIPATPTADSLNDYIQRMKYVMVNKMEITEANGNTVIYKDDNVSVYATVNGAYSSDSTTTTRLLLE